MILFSCLPIFQRHVVLGWNWRKALKKFREFKTYSNNKFRAKGDANQLAKNILNGISEAEGSHFFDTSRPQQPTVASTTQPSSTYYDEFEDEFDEDWIVCKIVNTLLPSVKKRHHPHQRLYYLNQRWAGPRRQSNHQNYPTHHLPSLFTLDLCLLACFFRVTNQTACPIQPSVLLSL